MIRVGVVLAALVAGVLSLGGCKTSNDDFCDAEHPCTDPGRPFCDTDGTYPASDGVARTCIPDPGGGGDCEGDGDCTDPSFPACELEQCRECRDATQCSAGAPVCGTDYACGACAAPADCAAYVDTPVCGASGACVECGGDEDCAGTTPVCGSAGTCEACTGHTQCASEICDIATGACVVEADIAYVTTAGTAITGCTRLTPCGTVQGGIDLGRPYVHVGPGTYDENLTVGGVSVTIVAAGAVVAAAISGAPVLLVGDGSALTVEGLTLREGRGGANGDGVRCVQVSTTPTIAFKSVTIEVNSGAGIDATGCAVALESSTVFDNRAGGVLLSGSNFMIRNSFIVRNGGTGSTFGGIKIDGPPAGGSQILEWSTLAGNLVADGITDPKGVFCSGVITPIAFAGLVVWGSDTQVSPTGNCTFEYSNLAGVAAAGTNISTEPTWVDAAAGNYHLAPGSAGIDEGGTTAIPATDFDGEARPQGSAADIGADETAP